jgi:Tfp pilus assembly protein PilN
VRAFSQQPSPFDDFTRRALDEAVSLYQDAVQQAEQQTRAELLQSLQSEPAAAATSTGPPATTEALSAFWLEQGLKEWQIQRVVKELQQDSTTAHLSVSALAARVTTLQRILPAADVAQMVYQQYTVLQLDANQVVQAMVHLVQHLPGGRSLRVCRV